MGEHADESATHLETSNSTVARLQVTDARETHGGNPAFSGERCKAPGCVGVKPDNSAAGLLPAGVFLLRYIITSGQLVLSVIGLCMEAYSSTALRLA